jgi:hypothetical protein
MRKVNLEIEATVMVPVTVTLDIAIKANEGADFEQAKITKINGKKVTDVQKWQFEDAVNELVEEGMLVKLSHKAMWDVTDSR